MSIEADLLKEYLEKTNQLKPLDEKSKLFKQYLTETNLLKDFKMEEINDETNGTAFTASHDIKGQKITLMIITDESAFSYITFLITTIDSCNKEKMLNLLNDLNTSQTFCKYYIDNNNHVILNFIYISKTDFFDPNTLLQIIDTGAQTLDEDIAKIMTIVWS